MPIQRKTLSNQSIIINWPPRWISGRAFASHTRDPGSIPSRDMLKSLKQVVTAPLPSARQQMWVSRLLGDDHVKRMISQIRCGTLKNPHCPWVPSIGPILKPFTGNGDGPIWVKILGGDVTPPPPKKKINIYFENDFKDVWKPPSKPIQCACKVV